MKEDRGVPVSDDLPVNEQAGKYTLADFRTHAVLFRVNRFLIFCGNGSFQCSCQIFHEHQTCRHLVALKTLVPSFPSFDLADLMKGFSKKDAD